MFNDPLGDLAAYNSSIGGRVPRQDYSDGIDSDMPVDLSASLFEQALQLAYHIGEKGGSSSTRGDVFTEVYNIMRNQVLNIAMGHVGLTTSYKYTYDTPAIGENGVIGHTIRVKFTYGGSGYNDLSQQFDRQIEQTRTIFSILGDMVDRTQAWAYPGKLYLFSPLVKTNSPYDLKNHAYSETRIGRYSNYHNETFRFDDYGNYNYGVAAKAFGLSLQMAVFAAGVNQVWNGRQDWSNLKGFLDDPRDTKMIIDGYNAFK